jgi:glycine oxidase
VNSDFLIIGGGVIGLSIARELHKRGAGSISVVDKGRIGAEASWAAAGMLAPNAECHADDELFRLCTASNRLYPDFAAELLDETGIDIELDRSGTLSVAFSDEEAAELDAKYEWQIGAGIDVEKLSAKEILDLEQQISPDVHSGYRYLNDWQVENRKLVAALRRYCEISGIELIENTAVTALAKEGIVIVTAGAWTNELLPKPQVKPIRGQMISLVGPIPRILRHVIYSPRGYVVPRADGRVLVGATVEDVGFCKEVTPEAIASLHAAAIEIAPALGDLDVAEAWSGLRPFVAGEIPVIGRVPERENVLVATGHYRNGILLAPITARKIADEIETSRPPQLGVPASAGPASL